MKLKIVEKLIVVYMLLVFIAIVSGCRRGFEREAAAMTGGDPARGKTAINRYGCAACHQIPGVSGPQGLVGPPLAGVASRVYIGGALGNTPANMIRWIQNPQAVDQKTAMPNLGVTDAEARDVAAYLYTLK
ncbi:MAG TPA: c-type cytochrome [Blastocatellia bacterium]|nr:c-type cytochrome [Blastocatellia bacterium]